MMDVPVSILGYTVVLNDRKTYSWHCCVCNKQSALGSLNLEVLQEDFYKHMRAKHWKGMG